jgi:Cell division protein FtsI/penicillin-binding protein 2
MGSIIKALTIAAGIDSGAVDENTYYQDNGSVNMNGYTIYNFDKKGRGWVPLQMILSKSLNTGIAYVVQKMGKESFRDYMLKFGLGSETGIDLSGEESGLINNLSGTTMIDYVTAGFGQGIALTPIQTIRALASLGNGGKLVNPHLIDKIDYKVGGVEKIVPNDPVQIFKKDTSERISRMLTYVVDHDLRNGQYKMENYSIAAKTGTAQIPKPGGGYYENKYFHSFFGYFPSYDPKFIILIYHKNPKGVEYASQTLTDSFFDLVKFLISYYEIPPDR